MNLKHFSPIGKWKEEEITVMGEKIKDFFKKL
jgi:predicted RNA-binding protein